MEKIILILQFLNEKKNSNKLSNSSVGFFDLDEIVWIDAFDMVEKDLKKLTIKYKNDYYELSNNNDFYTKEVFLQYNENLKEEYKKIYSSLEEYISTKKENWTSAAEVKRLIQEMKFLRIKELLNQ